jgi:RNA polymerase sigma-70 factor (ECF subfamily)
LVLDHASFVARVLVHLGVEHGRVDDASQEVFLIVLRQLDRFEGRSSLRTWLYGICRNVASSMRRGRARFEVPVAELPDSVIQPAQEGELWVKQAHERLVCALAELDEDQRQVFVLFEIEDESMEEIARSMNAPLSTTYSRLYAARQRVRAYMSRGALRPSKEMVR